MSSKIPRKFQELSLPTTFCESHHNEIVRHLLVKHYSKLSINLITKIHHLLEGNCHFDLCHCPKTFANIFTYSLRSKQLVQLYIKNHDLLSNCSEKQFSINHISNSSHLIQADMRFNILLKLLNIILSTTLNSNIAANFTSKTIQTY